MNFVFANHREDNSIYPLTTREIAELQSKDSQLVKIATKNGYFTQLVANIQVLFKDGKLVIPKHLQDQWLLGIITSCSTEDQHI